KPAPVIPTQPVNPPPAPQPQVVQQTSAPNPAVMPAPTPRSSAQTNVAFKGLAPDMEQRARDILDQVIANTKGASLPVLATQPPKPTPVIPGPQPQAQTPSTATNPPVRGPEATPAAVVRTPTKTIPPEQEAKAREMLNQLLAQPIPAPAPVPASPPQSTPVQKPTPAPVVVEKQAAPAPTPASPVVQQPAPAPKTVTKAPAPAAKPEIAAPMALDQEAKARELLNKTLATLPAPTPAPAPVANKSVESPTPVPVPSATPKVETKVAPEGDKPAQEDARRQAKLKADIDEQTLRYIARMEDESKTRASEMADRIIA